MRKIDPLFSHVNLQRKISKQTHWDVSVGLDKVLEAEPIKVETYDELVRYNAQILHYNRNITIFYRGQNEERKFENKTQLLPSIFRKFAGQKNLQLKERFSTLNEKSALLRKKVSLRKPSLAGTALLNKFPEIAWSILQHYQVCATPVLDISHSLHVACSFAFDNNAGSSGMIYALGMPWANDAIGYNTYEELFNIRLLSICPPQAQRPFFQEGYLTGHFPFHKMDDPKRIEQFDLARRLIAKFQIPIADSFWGDDFKPVPHAKLYPARDILDEICQEFRVAY
jgi:hypothetical protein